VSSGSSQTSHAAELGDPVSLADLTLTRRKIFPLAPWRCPMSWLRPSQGRHRPVEACIALSTSRHPPNESRLPGTDSELPDTEARFQHSEWRVRVRWRSFVVKESRFRVSEWKFGHNEGLSRLWVIGSLDIERWW